MNTTNTASQVNWIVGSPQESRIDSWVVALSDSSSDPLSVVNRSSIDNEGMKHAARMPVNRVAELFDTLTEQWEMDCMFSSSSTEMHMHPAYQQVIGLGPEVIPFVLRAMNDGQFHWDHALRALTRDDPVPEDSAGDMVKAQNSWMKWAQEHGYSNSQGLK